MASGGLPQRVSRNCGSCPDAILYFCLRPRAIASATRGRRVQAGALVVVVRCTVKFNPDGSVDIYFGPEAPTGKESNWIQTVPGKGWFTLLNLFGVTRAISSWLKPNRFQVVAVSYREMALLQDYSNKTGIPIDRCVSDALFDWLADVAPENLERFGLPPLNVQLGRRGITLVKSQKGS